MAKEATSRCFTYNKGWQSKAIIVSRGYPTENGKAASSIGLHLLICNLCLPACPWTWSRLHYWLAWWAALSLSLPYDPCNPSVSAANTTHTSGNRRGFGTGGRTVDCHYIRLRRSRGAPSPLTHTHTRTHVFMHTRLCAHTCTDTHAHLQTHTHTQTLRRALSQLRHGPGVGKPFWAPKVT